MVITIDNESNAILADSQNVEIVPARAGRRCIMLQLHAPGVVWIKFGGPASVGDGLCVNSMNIFIMPSGLPTVVSPGNDYYEGAINAFYQHVKKVGIGDEGEFVMRVIELS